MGNIKGNILAKGMAACMVVVTALSGCAGPSTRVLPREVSNNQPHEIPEEIQVLEEGNPFYLQESLDYLTSLIRGGNSPGEQEAVTYMKHLLDDYGYMTELQAVPADGDTEPVENGGMNVVGVRKAASPDADILLVATNHDAGPETPGANNNASGAVTWLECARLLSRLSTDTELRFVSFSGSGDGYAGARYYVDSLPAAERQRTIGAIYLGPLGYVLDQEVILGTMDGGETLLGNLLHEKAKEVTGRGWRYTMQHQGTYNSFFGGQVPAVMIRQSQEAYEAGSPYDRARIVDVEQLVAVVNILSQTAADLMGTDTPSQLAKSRFMNPLQDGAYVQQKNLPFFFGEDIRHGDAAMGMRGEHISSNTDGAGIVVDTYRYRMKWFDVDQIILTDYHYFDGKLETISIDADGAGITFDEMIQRISSWYGAPVEETAVPGGVKYRWEDLIYGKQLSLIPKTDAYEVEVEALEVEETEIGIYETNRNPTGQEHTDTSTVKILDLVGKIILLEDENRLAGIRIYTDGILKSSGYLDPYSESGGVAVPRRIHIDMTDAIDEHGEWRNRTETVRMLVKLYGELLAPEEADSNPEEFAANFMLFVLCQKPEANQNPADEQLLSFYESEALTEIRTGIRSHLQMDYEKPVDVPAPVRVQPIPEH